MRTISVGASGDAVKYLQQRLVAHGFVVKVDGSFGPATLQAVKQFQASVGLVQWDKTARDWRPDGIVGPMTWDALLVEERAAVPDAVRADAAAALWAQVSSGTAAVPRAVLEAATRDLGKREVPKGSNAGPEIAHLVDGYNEFWKIGDSERRPWCVMAVSSWIAIGLGLKTGAPAWGDWKGHPFFDDAKGGGAFRGSAADIEDWAKQKRWWTILVAGQAVQIPSGAYFTMARDGSSSDPSNGTRAGHAGLIVRDTLDGNVITIEGNVSDGVGSHVRRKDSLRGYAVWWR